MSLSSIILLIISVSCLIFSVTSSPVPSKRDNSDAKILFDQRQEGEWNVRADLDNFLILVIPTSSVSTSPSSPSLLDFLTKSISKVNHQKRNKHVKKHNPDAAEETKHFIESKTAPYHVDISKTKSYLDSKAVTVNSEPDVAGLRAGERARRSRALVLTVPANEQSIFTMIKDANKIRRDGKKKVIKDIEASDLKLLGAENEQCGPDLVRDSDGICRIIKKL